MGKTFIFDLDGTLHVDGMPITGAVEKISELRESGAKIVFLTNASTKTRKDAADSLSTMGFGAKPNEVYTGAYITARYVKGMFADKKVFVIGEKGLHEELESQKIEIVDKGADVVVAGLDSSFDYRSLSRALVELANGAVLVAANKDPVYPVKGGIAPGNGPIIAALECASGKKASVAGKPDPYPFTVIKQEHAIDEKEALVVGDTCIDVLFAKNCGLKSALVLTGHDSGKKCAPPPDYTFKSVAELHRHWQV
jgi:HAD superfamily hydrolase (TIGR01450 family)